jgi:hypothetical protein
MEAKFAWLEVRIISMAAQMKSIASKSGKTIKKKKKG